MATDDDGDKTEQPTERRRSQAREQGNIARSVDVNAAAVLLAACGGLSFAGAQSGEALLRVLQGGLSADPWLTADTPVIVGAMWSAAGLVAVGVLPIMLLTALAALGANLAQVGFLWSPEALAPRFERINPLQGLQRLFSLASVVRLTGSLLKIGAVAGVAWIYLWSRYEDVLALPQRELSVLLPFAGQALVELGFYLALTLVGLALLDYGYQFWQHEQDLRMTRQELREELKDMEGNPQVRARRREAHRKLAQAKELQSVKSADVVITNPTEIAVAVQYDPATMSAPTVVAKGQGVIAAQIRRLAAEHGVPILERKPLARALYRDVKVGGTIPVELYEVFVEILAYVYKITGRRPKTLK